MFGTRKNHRRGSSDDEEMDITPMIDVTFLLLIFFILTSKMEKSSNLQIPPARHGTGVPTEKSTVITIFKTEGDPEIYLSNEEKKNGPVDVSEVTAYVQAGISESKYNVIIKADRDIPSGIVEEVARAANEADVDEGELKFYVGVIDRPR